MKKLKGFTLIELMVTVLIGVILLTIAAPSFMSTIERNRVTTQTNEFVTTFNLARLEAIKRGSPVSVCVSTDGASCAATGNWAGGWMIFSDRNGNGVVDGTNCGPAAADDCVLRVWGALSNTNVDILNQIVTYNPDGRQTGVAFTLGIQSAHCTGNQRSQIVINVTGRPEATEEACI